MKRLALIDQNQYLFDPIKGVYSKYYKKYLKGVLSDTGYIKVSLNCIDGKKRRFLYHRVMAYIFIPNPDKKKFVDHINGNRLDNRVENLRWCTQEENNNFEPYKQKQKNNYKKSKPVFQYSLDGKLIEIWPSLKECERNGFNRWDVSSCCSGLINTHKGYKWSFEPL